MGDNVGLCDSVTMWEVRESVKESNYFSDLLSVGGPGAHGPWAYAKEQRSARGQAGRGNLGVFWLFAYCIGFLGLLEQMTTNWVA